MNKETQGFIKHRGMILDRENDSLALDLEMAKIKVTEIERRMACNAGIAQGLKQILEAAK